MDGERHPEVQQQGCRAQAGQRGHDPRAVVPVPQELDELDHADDDEDQRQPHVAFLGRARS